MLTISSFTWQPDGRYGVVAGTLVAAALVLWTYGLVGLYTALAPRLPRFAALGGLVTVIGAASGVTFGVRGFFDGVFGLDQQASLAALAVHQLWANLLFFWPGPVFPLMLLVLGVALLVAVRDLPRVVGLLLIVAGIGFPVSRTLRVEWIAHVVDLAMLAAFAVLAVRLWRGWTALPRHEAAAAAGEAPATPSTG